MTTVKIFVGCYPSAYQMLKKMIITIAAVIGILVIGVFIFLQQPQFGDPPNGTQTASFVSSGQFTGEKFQNEGGITVSMNFLEMIKMMPEWLSGNGNKRPDWSIPVVMRDKEEFEHVSDTLSRVTWFGHSAFLLEIDGKKILIDPMLGPSPSPVGFVNKRFNDTLPISIADLPKIDAVLFSHDHYDHLDYGSVLELKDKVGHFFTPLGVGSHLKRWGIDENKITEFDWWQGTEFKGLHLVATPAQHFSGRGLGDRDKTLWCSWVIEGKTNKLFFSGDSGYFPGFKEIGEKFGPFDLCMVECGQYNELWHEIHMMPEETVQAHLDLKGNVLIPIHWGAFNLAFHGWTDSIERSTKAAKEKGVNVATPRIGESYVVNGEIPQTEWWVKK